MSEVWYNISLSMFKIGKIIPEYPIQEFYFVHIIGICINNCSLPVTNKLTVSLLLPSELFAKHLIRPGFSTLHSNLSL